MNLFQMNLFTKRKQTHEHRKHTMRKQWRDKLGICNEQIHTNTYKIVKQQGPTIQHRE